MAHYEAVEDNILMEYHNGHTWYYPPCRICGTPVASWGYRRDLQYTCSECKRYLVEAKINQDSLDRKTLKFEQAVKRISKVTDIGRYETAIMTVKKSLDKKGWFQSTEEIMVAIELVKRGFKVHHQVKIYEFSVDFIIPELQVALEIDGRVFHGKDKKARESIRDEVIREKLGDGWKLIRIDTDNINTNITKLIPAIKAVRKSRMQKRVQYSSP